MTIRVLGSQKVTSSSQAHYHLGMSLVRLGQSPAGEETASGLLLDCHTRIRSFAELAVRLAEDDAPDAELADAAARVHRYFTQALPLHVADEERSVAPRLRQIAPETVEALETMEREHRAHDELLARLVPAWEALRSDPRLRRETHADALRLRAELEAHLAAEERLIVPALARLPAEESRAIVTELRARRTK
jgi:iron-sulfur cluster repair protein YtfE (RIC family)